MSARNRRARAARRDAVHAATHRPLVSGVGERVSTVAALPDMYRRDRIGDRRGTAPAWLYDRVSSTSADRAPVRRKDVGQHWAQSYPDARYRSTATPFTPADACAR